MNDTPVTPEFEQWKKDPSPDNLATVLKTLEPTVVSEVQRYSGPKTLLRAKAKTLAIKAVQTYDPTKGAQLRSWVVTQLQPLSRYSQRLRPVRVSEMAIRQAAEVHTQGKHLEEELGHTPTTEELADRVGISKERIEELQRTVRPVVSESSMVDPETGEPFQPAVTQTNVMDFASEAVYDSLTPREKQIYDWKTGGHGQAMMPNQEIAKRLGVTPALISQISQQIAGKIQGVGKHAV